MENRLQIQFGLRCKDLRLKAGYSQERFANLINMDRSYYASIEVGRRNVTLSSMKKIAEGLGIELSELLENVG
jgi:transcriptional regulator with XRE-family HTH domain